MPKSDQEKFFNDEVIVMHEKAQGTFANNDLVKTKEWLDACTTFN